MSASHGLAMAGERGPPVGARGPVPGPAVPVRPWHQAPLLEVEHLTMRFGGLVAIDDLSFTAGKREITAIIGPNGAGKTTVFNCLTGFYKPTVGSIRMNGDDGPYHLERMFDFEINRYAGVARTFQNIRLFGRLTVLENLIVAQHTALMRHTGFIIGAVLGLSGYRRAERRAVERAHHWLERTGLIHRADDPAGSLPYGDQRRLEIARALCTGPRLLCLDEPAAGLNPRESAELTRLLTDIRDAGETAILLIEHDMSVVMGISDHVVVLDYGRKISDGTAAEVRDDPEVIRAYLGVEEDEAAAMVAVQPVPVASAEAEALPSGAAAPVTDSPRVAAPHARAEPAAWAEPAAPAELHGTAPPVPLQPAGRTVSVAPVTTPAAVAEPAAPPPHPGPPPTHHTLPGMPPRGRS